jgi:hypothetical protein
MRLIQDGTGHGESPDRIEHGKSEPLILRSKKSKVSKSSSQAITVSVKTLESEQTAVSRQKALRLFCRAMIRLYIQDQGKPEDGKRLGLL